MFGDVNKVFLMGNITNDPDLRFTTGGTAVLNFGLATNRSYQVDGEWTDEVTYHNIVVWRSAESLSKRIRKGTRIYIEGRIQVSSWEGNDGKKNYKTEINADSVSLISRYEGSNDDGATGGSSKNTSTKKSKSDEEEIDPNDLPF